MQDVAGDQGSGCASRCAVDDLEQMVFEIALVIIVVVLEACELRTVALGDMRHCHDAFFQVAIIIAQ